MQVPDGMPTLALGGHREGEGEACVMEYVSIIAGEKFSDSPKCTWRPLKSVAIEVNDTLRDEERHLLIPFITRLINTPPPATRDEQDALWRKMSAVRDGLDHQWDAFVAERVQKAYAQGVDYPDETGLYSAREYAAHRIARLDAVLECYEYHMGTHDTVLDETVLRQAHAQVLAGVA